MANCSHTDNTSTHATEQNLVYMEDITVCFGEVTALECVNFRVEKNEIVGLLGDNGAGKTTLMNALIGALRPSSGEIYFDGKKANFESPRDARSAGIETKYQDLPLVDSVNVPRNFFLGRELCRDIRLFKNIFYRTGFMDQKKMAAITATQLRELGLSNIPDLHKQLRFFSGGERQAIAIARSLYFGAKLLILDEPTISLSDEETHLVLKLVLKAKQRGLSVIFVTHKANEVFQVADRFVLLQNGRNFADFRKADTNLKELERLFIYTRLTALRELSASVAHQVNTPLTVMKTSVQMLHEDFEVANRKEEYSRITQMLMKKIELLQHVVSDFLDFSHPLKFHRTNACVKDVIDSALRNTPLENYPDIEVDLSGVDGNIGHLMDYNLMQQAVSNLVLNALESSRPGQRVEIKSYSRNNRLFIEVQDHGSGIDVDTQKKIFDYFFTTKNSGTGLGLPIVQRIVEQHNGSISVESTLDKGSLFRIEI
jgi:simple sugar transport system ATP-binding protein